MMKIFLKDSNRSLSLELLKEACQLHPYLKVKIAVDSLRKKYISLGESADFMNLPENKWRIFLENYEIGDLERIKPDLRNLVPSTELRFLTGFTDQQLRMLEYALEIPFLIAERHENLTPLLQELRILVILGVILTGQRHKFKSFRTKVIW